MDKGLFYHCDALNSPLDEFFKAKKTGRKFSKTIVG